MLWAQVVGVKWGFWAQEGCSLWNETLTFDFTALNSPRFTDNGDDTVTDNNTKLMWSKNANLYDVQEWNQAESLSDGTTLAGHSDWRLPAISELKSLIDKNQFDPALPPGNPFMNVQSYYYWSRHEWESPPDGEWCVDMNDGSLGNEYKDDSNYVWPVRSGN